MLLDVVVSPWVVLFYTKVLLGVTFAAPPGPVTTEAIQRGLTGGFMPAFKVKLGAAVGDLIFITVASFFLAFICKYQNIANYLSIIGSSVLLYMGYRNLKKAIFYSDNTKDTIIDNRKISGIIVGFGIAISSPFALGFWLGEFSANPPDLSNLSLSLISNAFIMVGILLWDVIFCLFLALGKKIVSKNSMRVISALAGVFLCYYGGMFFIKAMDNFNILANL